MSEVRNRLEGELRWVQASGTGATWATASAPASGLVGFVRNFTFTSAATVATIMERGIPHHNKMVSKQPVNVAATFAWTGTNAIPASGSGASVPMYHLELKYKQPEKGNTGMYYQFYGVPFPSLQFSEGDEENTIALTLNNILAMNGPTGSGYLG